MDAHTLVNNAAKIWSWDAVAGQLYVLSQGSDDLVTLPEDAERLATAALLLSRLIGGIAAERLPTSVEVDVFSLAVRGLSTIGGRPTAALVSVLNEILNLIGSASRWHGMSDRPRPTPETAQEATTSPLTRRIEF